MARDRLALGIGGVFHVTPDAGARFSRDVTLGRMTQPTLLVLGGTQWLGREIAAQALQRGYDVTCLARGESGAIPAGATLLRADRSEFGAYDEAAARSYDFAVEVSREPKFVSEAVRALSTSVGHWTYVSTVSVYAESAEPNTENSPRVAGLAWDVMEGDEYAAAKVACEDATLRRARGQRFRATPWHHRRPWRRDGPLDVLAQSRRSRG